MTVTAERAALIIDKPGVYDGIPDEQYHADPVPAGSLSSSGARKLLPPSCPAIFHHERKHGEAPRDFFDLGHAAHKLVLGVGPELYVVDADDYRTKAAQKERDDARAAGMVPLLVAEFDQVQGMAAALRQHPVASDLLSGDGVAEQSLFWVDPETGMWCRARPDWMTPERLVDYKTTADPYPPSVARSVHKYGYHQQADFYLTGAIELDLVSPDAEFVFIFQGKSEPYLITIVDLDDDALAVGSERNSLARQIYHDCTVSDHWPAWSEDIETISLPAYALRQTGGYL